MNSGRTIAVGDIHGDCVQLTRLLGRLPTLEANDTLLFIGDYLDRGPDSRAVIEVLQDLPRRTPARLVFLKGNHEDSWLKVIDEGFPEFVLPPGNGCWACARSFLGMPPNADVTPDGMRSMLEGTFFPADVVAWMRGLMDYWEDEHAIYVHAGLAHKDGRFLHPSEVEDKKVLFWSRSAKFFKGYRGKRVICGHTATEELPPLSLYTPDDPTDLWYTQHVIAIDTKCGKEGGFLTAIELPAMRVYESR